MSNSQKLSQVVAGGVAPVPVVSQATGFTATGGTTPKTLTVDVDVTASVLVAKQDALVAGTNIKNINDVSPLGSGNLATGIAQWTFEYKISTGSLTIPNGVTTCRVYAIGAGGNGVAASSASTAGAAGGGGGGCAWGEWTVVAGDVFNVTISAGDSTVNYNGGATMLTANNGANGSGATGGAGGTATKDASVVVGGAYSGGAGGSTTATTAYLAGGGGSSGLFGNGAGGAASTANANGGGGGGAAVTATATYASAGGGGAATRQAGENGYANTVVWPCGAGGYTQAQAWSGTYTDPLQIRMYSYATPTRGRPVDLTTSSPMSSACIEHVSSGGSGSGGTASSQTLSRIRGEGSVFGSGGGAAYYGAGASGLDFYVYGGISYLGGGGGGAAARNTTTGSLGYAYGGSVTYGGGGGGASSSGTAVAGVGGAAIVIFAYK